MSRSHFFGSVWFGLFLGCRPRILQSAQWQKRVSPLQIDRSASNANRFSQEEDDTIVRLVREKHTYDHIGRVLGRRSGSVWFRWRHYLSYRYPELRQRRKEGNSLQGLDESAKKERNEQIVRAVQAGKTLVEVARECSPPLSPQSVRLIYNEACPPEDRSTGSANKPFTPAEVQQVQRNMAEGVPINQIANELHRSVDVIRRLAERQGISSKAVRPVVRRPFTQDDVDRLRKMKLSGHRWNDIASALGRTPGQLRHKWGHMGELIERRGMWTSAERAELLNLHDQGLTQIKLAAHFKRSIDSVRRCLRGELRKQGRLNLNRRLLWSDEEDRLLLSSISQGMTHPEIAALLPGRSAIAVRKRLFLIRLRTKTEDQ